MLYTVKTGDSLSKIARDVLGNMKRWPEIAKLNQLTPPYIIHPNEILLLPDPPVGSPARPRPVRPGTVVTRPGVPVRAPGAPGAPAQPGAAGFLRQHWWWLLPAAGFAWWLFTSGGQAPRRR